MRNSSELLRFFISGVDIPELPKDAGEESVANIDKLRHSKGGVRTADLRLELQKTMQHHATVFRNASLLQEGCKKVVNW